MKTNKRFVMCHDITGKTYRISSDKLVFRPSVYGILIERGKVLLSPQWDGYDIPGGGVHIHETIQQALKREFWEETGLRVKSVMPVYVGTSFFMLPHTNKQTNCTLMYFLCKKIGGKITTKYLDVHEKKYAKAAQWVPLSQVGKLKFYNSVDSAKLIRLASQKKFMPS